MRDPETVIRSIIRAALDDAPALLPQERRYASEGNQRSAKDSVAREIARALAANGFLAFDAALAPAAANFSAVSFTMQRMRNRLLQHMRAGERTVEGERQAMQRIAADFFHDLETRGWRLTRADPLDAYGGHLNVPGPLSGEG